MALHRLLDSTCALSWIVLFAGCAAPVGRKRHGGSVRRCRVHGYPTQETLFPCDKRGLAGSADWVLACQVPGTSPVSLSSAPDPVGFPRSRWQTIDPEPERTHHVQATPFVKVTWPTQINWCAQIPWFAQGPR